MTPVSVVETGTRRLLVVGGAMLAILLQTLDLTIVNVTLPTIEGNLGAALDEATWVVIGYMVPAVIVIPLTPWLQLRFGRKRYFLTCIAGFVLASVCCGLSQSIDALIAFRVVQGMFGGGLLATAQTILRDTFPPSAVGLSQSIYMMGIIIGPSLGPVLGGVLTDNFSWPWTFFVNVVPGTIAFFALLVALRDPTVPRKLPFDALGVACLTVTVFCLEYVLEQGERWDWFDDASIRVAAAGMILGLVAFVVRETTAKAPIVDLSVLRNKNVVVGIVLMMANTFTIYGQQFIMPQFLNESLGFTATLSGVTLVSRAMPIAILTIPIGMLAGKVVPLWILITAGLACSGVSDILLAHMANTATPVEAIAGVLMLTGVGLALANTPILMSVIGAVRGPNIPKAAAFLNLSMQLGGSIASSALVTVLDRRETFHQSILAGGVTMRAMATQPHMPDMTTVVRVVASQAVALGYADSFWCIGALTLATLPVIWFVQRRPATG